MVMDTLRRRARGWWWTALALVLATGCGDCGADVTTPPGVVDDDMGGQPWDLGPQGDGGQEEPLAVGQPCQSSASCASGFCVAGRCAAAAPGPACGAVHCPQEQVCLPDGTCGEFRCEGEGIMCGDGCCEGGQECVEGQCLAPCGQDQERCKVEGQGFVCCEGGQACLFGGCVALGETCGADLPCHYTQLCEPSLGRCIPRNTDHGQCLELPQIGAFDPFEIFAWVPQGPQAEYDQVMMAPMVGNLTDDNGDGVIDFLDVPDIVFVTFRRGGYNSPGVLRVISGDDGREHWNSRDLATPFWVRGASGVALGDIDGDRVMEIIVVGDDTNGGVFAVEHDGAIKWHQAGVSNGSHTAAALADVDGDGAVEIATHNALLAGADGRIICQLPSASSLPMLQDLDGDGVMEVLHGARTHRVTNAAAADGSGCEPFWDMGGGMGALGDFDEDPEPEVVVVGGGKVRVLEHDGALQWEVDIPISEARAIAEGGVDRCPNPTVGRESFCHPGGGPPTVADFDGDLEPEIGVATRWFYLVFDTDGQVLWAHPTRDFSSAVTGSSVFDFEGDGKAEVVYNDELFLRVYKGSGTGSDADGDGFVDADILLEIPNPSGTLYEYPVIADVNNDGAAEIVVAANNYAFPGATGVRVFGDRNGTWVPTRRIWNQHTYHITNIGESGQIPRQELANWSRLSFNNYRQNSQSADAHLAPDVVPEQVTIEAPSCAAGVVIRFKLRNEGSRTLQAGDVTAAVYLGLAGQPADRLAGTVTNDAPIVAGAAQDFELRWVPPPAFTDQNIHARVVADDDGTGQGNLQECDEENNEASSESVLCQGIQ